MPRKGPSLGPKYTVPEEETQDATVREVVEEIEIIPPDVSAPPVFVRDESVEIPEGYVDPIMNFIPEGNVMNISGSNIAIQGAPKEFEDVYDKDGRKLNFNEIQDPVDWAEVLSQQKPQDDTENAPDPEEEEDEEEEETSKGLLGKKKKNRKRKVNAETLEELKDPELLKQRILLQEAEEEEKKKKKNRKNKKEQQEREPSEENKTASPADDGRPVPKGYPREYFDPTDAEVDEKDGKTYYYFNIEKTLRLHNWMFITKLFSLEKLEDWTYDNPRFDAIAQRQHDTAERLNNASPTEQYRHDQRNRLIKFGSVAVTVLMFVCLIFFHTIPSHRFENAMEHMVAEEYEEGYNILSSLGMKYDSFVYAKYAEGCLRLASAREASAGTAGTDINEETANEKIADAIEQYDGAKDCFEKLVPYADRFTNLFGITQEESEKKMSDMVNECEYSKGRMLYQAKQFEQAASIFKNIHNYSDATENYYKTTYEIADDFYEKGDYFNAIDHFYPIATAKYSDSEDRMKELAQELYDVALANYNRQKYEDAIETFAFLANYSYLDSEDLINKCKYNYALNFYKAGNYEKASENLAGILPYKDAIALKKDCTYRLGVIAYNNKPVESIRYFNSIRGFRNSDEILDSDNLVLFGEWEITELNGAPITQTTFTFSGNGLFKTKSANIIGTAISTDSTEYPYRWNGHGYETEVEGVKYTMEMKIANSREITLTCSNDSKEHSYTCKRLKTYLEMVNSGTEKEEENGNISLNDKLKIVIGQYIKKKTDQVYTYNGLNIDATADSLKIESVEDKENDATRNEIGATAEGNPGDSTPPESGNAITPSASPDS